MALILLVGFDLADSAFAVGIYRLSELELRRKLFFEDHLTREESLELGYCYLKRDRYERAYPLLSGKGREGEYLLARYHLAAGNYRAAEIELTDLLLEDDADSIREMLGVALFLEERYDEASKYISLKGWHQKSTSTAVLLSSILPGSGEIYSGRPLLGLLDLVANGITGYLFYRAVRNRSYLDGFLILHFLLVRFYNGSRNNAYHAAEAWNLKRREQFLTENGWDRWLRF
ncbi:hypothetical protein DRP53_05345 [candidate division WOR-3 bacterium]|uniref:Tetratricopeptide repeat protein n=1 Tax=candidate division WOR-3 bacterium TaxID=2052148 RepID=A0A660SHP7_UNCW3|nr:MAG: hypothetical protein DRP53_05345 [candidate division WOR-3 bacterium]